MNSLLTNIKKLMLILTISLIPLQLIARGGGGGGSRGGGGHGGHGGGGRGGRGGYGHGGWGGRGGYGWGGYGVGLGLGYGLGYGAGYGYGDPYYGSSYYDGGDTIINEAPATREIVYVKSRNADDE
jgi:hypothetical protein